MATKKTALKRWQPYILTQTLMSFVTQIRRSCCVNITKQQMSVTSNSPKTQKERVKMCLWWTNSGMYLQLYMDHVKKHVTMFLSPPHNISSPIQSNPSHVLVSVFLRLRLPHVIISPKSLVLFFLILFWFLRFCTHVFLFPSVFFSCSVFDLSGTL